MFSYFRSTASSNGDRSAAQSTPTPRSGEDVTDEDRYRYRQQCFAQTFDMNVLDGPLKDVILGMSKEMELDPGVLLTLLMPVNYILAKLPTGKSARSSNS